MTLSPRDCAALISLFPDFESRGLSGAALDRAIDAWYAKDYYDDNPVHTLEDDPSPEPDTDDFSR